MPKYLLLKHYRGGPEPHHPFPPMDQWAPEDIEAHIAFQRHVSELSRRTASTSAPRRSRRRAPGCATAARTPRPSPPTARSETSELMAGWYMIEVDSHERGDELAAYVSSEPGPGGEPLYEWIDVRRSCPGRPARTDGVIESPEAAGRGRAALSSRGCSQAWSAGARTSTPPRTRWQRRGSRRAGRPRAAPRGPQRVADHGRDAAAHRAAQRGRPSAPRERGAGWRSRPGRDGVGENDALFLCSVLSPDLAPASRWAPEPARGRRLTSRRSPTPSTSPRQRSRRDQPRQARRARARTSTSPGDLAVVLRMLYVVYSRRSRHAPPGRPGRRGDQIAGSSTSPQRGPRRAGCSR